MVTISSPRLVTGLQQYSFSWIMQVKITGFVTIHLFYLSYVTVNKRLMVAISTGIVVAFELQLSGRKAVGAGELFFGKKIVNARLLV